LSFLKFIRLFTLFFSCYFLFAFSSFSSQQNTALSTIETNELYGNQLKFSHFSGIDGLSSSNVFAIDQDKQGYLWIATEDGLNRFDGKKFQTYRHDINNKHSISDNVIRKIFIDHENTLWVGTQNGLSRYNRELDNFDNYYHDDSDDNSLTDNVIWDIYQDNKNLLWVSTGTGLHTITLPINSKAIPTFNAITITDFSDTLSEVKTIFQDNNNNYWFGSYDNGIHLANENLTYIGSLQEKNKVNLHVNAYTLFDLKEVDGQLWLATDNGVFIVTLLSKNQYQLDSHISTQGIQQYNANNISNTVNLKQKLLSNHIRAIAKYNDNNVWLATDKGLSIIDLLNDDISNQQKNTNSTSLSENWLMTVFKDNNGTIWLGSYGGGLNKYSPLSAKLYHGLAELDIKSKQHFRVESFTQVSDGSIYLSTEQQGIFKVEGKSIYKISSNAPDNLLQIMEGDGNVLWLITRQKKLFKYDLTENKMSEQKDWQANAKYSTRKFAFFINKSLWYINQKGELTQYQTKEKKFKHFSVDKSNKLINLQKDDDGLLWLTTSNNKIISFDTINLIFTIKPFKLSNDFQSKKITSLAIGPSYIWLGTDSQGLTLINKVTERATTFNESSGLKNNYVASILIDEKSNAWLANNKGLSVINPVTKKTLHFDTDFSLISPEFFKGASLKSTEGQFYFGSPKGFYQFTPSELLNIKQHITEPQFTDLYIANKKISIEKNIKQLVQESESHEYKSEGYSLSKQLNSLGQVILEHNHSPVSFEFVSPNAKLPNQLGYRYRLTGLENQWVDAGKDNQRATYTNLSSGFYTFEVQAYDLQSRIKSKANRLSVHVLPPLWLTNSAVLVYTVISLLFISFIFQQIRHRRLYHWQIKENEERLKLSLWGSGDEMWDWNMTTGTIFRSNIWGKLEFPQDGSRNTVVDEQKKREESNSEHQSNIHHRDLERVKYALTQHTSGQSEHYEATYRVQDKANQWIWVLDRGKIVERNEKKQPTRMTGTLKDISQMKTAEARLKLFAKCIENISDAVVIYDKQFITVDINKAFVEITGNDREKMLGQALTFSQYPDDFCKNIKKHLVTKGRWHGEVESLRNNGSKFFTDLNIDVIYDENDSISHFVGVFSDITKRKTTDRELRRLASSDTLTGLPNRAFFQANQTRLVKSKTPHALLVFDLDNFKKVNDSLGHQVGDAILCKIAERIVNLGRKQDSIYRLGGDEFSILIENTNDIHTITSIANQILSTIAQPFRLKSQEVVLYSSIGIVLYPDDGATSHELLKNADTAMYHAKNAGGNQYQFFNDSMNRKAVHRLQVENLIRHGLKEDAFSVFYQPKISIVTGKIAGMEALVRFQAPNRDIVSPAVFIPVSEETGQIIDIGEVVLRKACFAAKKWVDEELFTGRVAVNLSAVQFTQANLVALIANILTESKLPAKHLELEITEGTVMDDPQRAIATMEQIRAMGIHLSLDDFGTGYSSLAYLKKFPLNTLKIDKAFVDDIEVSEQGRNMVATIVTIAHNLGMDVVAEGVETNKQLTFLTSLGCEQLQGYLYSKPLPTEKFQQYLISHQVTNKSTEFINH
jgi:diguanylate cyclase (GGDEF)-like protein/PAS domain S-box-containing protein